MSEIFSIQKVKKVSENYLKHLDLFFNFLKGRISDTQRLEMTFYINTSLLNHPNIDANCKYIILMLIVKIKTENFNIIVINSYAFSIEIEIALNKIKSFTLINIGL